ncbi:hypothetical protein Vadar_003453 [Vaccinium darrowii]|uniref:Uncharacterized protein n=1 Tax=Vaccinium darrowii TaxID=229202 RepID=A0ACB7XF69_9ERIC|nr:hypothetical protein Vadar_003453 [Vaccinium darrowii]
MRPSEDDLGLSKLSESLNKAGYNAYNAMSWFVESKLIPTVRTVYSYNETITIFAPWDTAFWCGNNCPMTKILQQVVPLNLDRNTFKTNFSKDSTFPTFSKDYTNPSFQFSDHIKITQPLIDNAAMGTYASINNVPIIHWELYNDGRVIVHGVPCVFKAFRVELNNQTKLSQTESYVPINWGRMELNNDKKLALRRCRYSS